MSALVAAGVLCVGGVAVAFTEFGGSEPTGNTSIARKNDNVPNVETAEPLDSPKPPKRTNDKPTTRPAEDEPRQTRTERPSETPEAKPSPSPTPTTPTKKPTPTPTPSVTRKVVPDVLGLTLAQAVDRLAAAGFKSKILVSGGEPAQDCFKVVQQDPAGGMRSDIRRPVELVVDPAAGCETPEPTVTPTATGSKPAAA
ncbi:PASTA domain-containing protein [Thermocatellispora tengchongensis]|uniref:PASTA domain-containing protein n=1 Tax=Thermocatellispora tengchongensis TaxID=1073253 RepID=UPI00363AA4C0